MKFRAFLLAIILIPSLAMADGRELATKNIRELQTMTNTDVAAGDLVPIYDASDRQFKKLDATTFTAGTGATASTSLYGNPLQMNTVGVVTAAQINNGATVIVGSTGKVIYPGAGFTLMASGAAASATAVVLKCTGNTVASFPIARLADVTPTGPFASGGVTLSSALTRGCPAGESLLISNTGSALTGTTHLYYSIPYIVQ